MARATSTSVVLNSLTSWRSTWGRVQAGKQRRATFAAFLFICGLDLEQWSGGPWHGLSAKNDAICQKCRVLPSKAESGVGTAGWGI